MSKTAIRRVDEAIINTLRNRDVLGRNVLINRVSATIPRPDYVEGRLNMLIKRGLIIQHKQGDSDPFLYLHNGRTFSEADFPEEENE